MSVKRTDEWAGIAQLLDGSPSGAAEMEGVTVAEVRLLLAERDRLAGMIAGVVDSARRHRTPYADACTCSSCKQFREVAEAAAKEGGSDGSS